MLQVAFKNFPDNYDKKKFSFKILFFFPRPLIKRPSRGEGGKKNDGGG